MTKRGRCLLSQRLHTTVCIPNKDMYVCIYIYIYVYICICMCIYIYIYTHTYIHTYIHAYIHTYIHSYTHTLIHSYTHTLIHSYTHTLIHTANGRVHGFLRKRDAANQRGTAKAWCLWGMLSITPGMLYSH